MKFRRDVLQLGMSDVIELIMGLFVRRDRAKNSMARRQSASIAEILVWWSRSSTIVNVHSGRLDASHKGAGVRFLMVLPR